jgi:hypothetical protein
VPTGGAIGVWQGGDHCRASYAVGCIHRRGSANSDQAHRAGAQSGLSWRIGNPVDVLIVGGRQNFSERLEQLRAVGTFHGLIRFLIQTQEHILRAMQIIGDQVIPQVS